MDTTRKGELFENRVYDIIRAAIRDGNFGFMPECCKVFKKPAYHYNAREGNIIFDLSIEIWPKGADRCHILYLIECKDYNHAVPVDDVEEFLMKANQIRAASVKPVFVTTARLQNAALKFVKNKNFMLIHVDRKNNNSNIIFYNKSRKKDLIDQPVNAWYEKAKQLEKINALLEESKKVNLDWDTFIKEFLTSHLNFQEYWSQPGEPVEGIEFLSKKFIEDITTSIINNFDCSIIRDYKPFPLHDFLGFLSREYGVITIVDQPMPEGKKHLNGFYDRQDKRFILILTLSQVPLLLFVLMKLPIFFSISRLKYRRSCMNLRRILPMIRTYKDMSWKLKSTGLNGKRINLRRP